MKSFFGINEAERQKNDKCACYWFEIFPKAKFPVRCYVPKYSFAMDFNTDQVSLQNFMHHELSTIKTSIL